MAALIAPRQPVASATLATGCQEDEPTAPVVFDGAGAHYARDGYANVQKRRSIVVTGKCTFEERVLNAPKAPDFQRFTTMLRREEPDRAVLYEFFIHPPVADCLIGRPFPDVGADSIALQLALIEAYHHAGYDYAPLIPQTFAFRLPHREQARASSVSMNDGAMICDVQDLGRYTWPNGRDASAACLRDLAHALPGGMKFISCTPGGVLENTIRMLGFENFCILAMDEDPLAQAVIDKVGRALSLILRVLPAVRQRGRDHGER